MVNHDKSCLVTSIRLDTFDCSWCITMDIAEAGQEAPPSIGSGGHRLAPPAQLYVLHRSFRVQRQCNEQHGQFESAGDHGQHPRSCEGAIWWCMQDHLWSAVWVLPWPELLCLWCWRSCPAHVRALYFSKWVFTTKISGPDKYQQILLGVQRGV
jgi:hypothetical protein